MCLRRLQELRIVKSFFFFFSTEYWNLSQGIYLFLKFYVFMYLFLVVLSLHCFSSQISLSAVSKGYSLVVVPELLTVVTSLVVEHTLGTRASVVVTWRLSCLVGMWDPPRPGFEPMSPALAGRFLITGTTRNIPPRHLLMCGPRVSMFFSTICLQHIRSHIWNQVKQRHVSSPL